MSAKVSGQRPRIPPHGNTEQRQTQQRRYFGCGKYILNQRSGFHSEDIYNRKKNYEQDRDQILCIDSYIHIAQNHRPEANRWNLPEMQNPSGGRNRRKENSEELAERHAYGRNRPGLNHQKQRPAVEKTPQRPERFAQINILPPGPRHHRRQLAIAQRGDDRHEPRHCPRANQQCRRIHLAGNLRRNNKDARADHRPHDQHRGAGQAQALDQFTVLMAMRFPVAARGGCRCTQDSSDCANLTLDFQRAKRVCYFLRALL